jgi:hypothetical protein
VLENDDGNNDALDSEDDTQSPDSGLSDSTEDAAENDADAVDSDDTQTDSDDTETDEDDTANSGDNDDNEESSETESTEGDEDEDGEDPAPRSDPNTDEEPEQDDQENLQAAGQDADENAGDGDVDDPASSCSAGKHTPAPAGGVTPPPPPVPGNLQVTVKNGKTGNPIKDASVNVTGPQSMSDKTGDSGILTYNGVQTGSYTATAKKDGFDDGSASGAVNPAALTNLDIELAPRCWLDDYEKDISVTSYGRYYRSYKADGTENSFNDPVTYKIVVPVKTGTKISAIARFKPEKQADVTDADVTAAKTKLENGLSTYWAGKFTLEVDDPQCGKKSFSIEYKAEWVTSGEDYTLKVHKTYPREGVTGNVMDVSKTTSAWTYAHESGHCFGLPDEYSYSTHTETVKYIEPDGSLDAAISAPPDGKSKTAADATIMSAVNNTKTLPRHAWNIAIEVQELLTAKLGRNIKCSIK